MATPFSPDSYLPYTVLLTQVGKEHVVGVLLQGPSFPVVLSVAHAFEPVVVGSTYIGVLSKPHEVISVKVIHANKEHDFVLFEVLNLIDRETAPVDTFTSSTPNGEPYVMMGNSSCERVDSGNNWKMTWAATPGYLTTNLLDFCVIGTGSGSSPGDSGGPIFSRITNKVIGMNIAASNLHPGWSDNKCARARVSCQGNMKPLWIVEIVMSVLSGGGRYFQVGGERAYYAQPININVPTECINGPPRSVEEVYAVRRQQQSVSSLDEQNEGRAADSERFANLKLAFSMATHCLLTACPREEFSGHFSFLKAYQQDALCKLYKQMVVSVQENLQEEFRDICEETRVVDACDDEFLLRQYMDNNGVRRRVTAMGRKSIINAKINELESLKETLKMVKEQNHDSALKVKALKDGIETSDNIAETDAAMVKLKELNAKLGSAVPKKRKLEFTWSGLNTSAVASSSNGFVSTMPQNFTG